MKEDGGTYSGHSDDATIVHCPHGGCQFRCCKFDQGNFIVLYPSEIDNALASGSSIKHLEIHVDTNGGHKAICKARNTANCDGGYKPLDCASYPLFPVIKPGGEIADSVMLFGAKCPLPLAWLSCHWQWVVGEWTELARDAKIVHWLRSVRLVGYKLTTRGNGRVNTLPEI
jgi:hypothetical protein